MVVAVARNTERSRSCDLPKHLSVTPEVRCRRHGKAKARSGQAVLTYAREPDPRPDRAIVGDDASRRAHVPMNGLRPWYRPDSLPFGSP